MSEHKYKFSVGQRVSLMRGWELPLVTGKIINRRTWYSQEKRAYITEYLLEGLYDGHHNCEEHELTEHTDDTKGSRQD